MNVNRNGKSQRCAGETTPNGIPENDLDPGPQPQ